MRLGIGGAGEVHLVEDAKGSKFAVKILDPKIAAEEPACVDRFVQEAEFALKSRHPNLVPVYDAGRDPDTGLCYIVMEYQPGGTLRELISASREGLPLARAAAIASDIAHALSYIEANGLVHRDVKPENVLFAPDGTARLSDLGASLFRTDGGNMRVTDAEKVVGTPAYMAPEQMFDSHSADMRADIYSLGIVLFEMLAGRRPNDGETAMNSFAKALEGRMFPDVRTLRPDTPPPLAALISRMIDPDPAKRPSSARSVLLALINPMPATMPSRTTLPETPRAATDAIPESPWYADKALALAALSLAVSLAVLAAVLFAVSGGGAR
ncbi:MAG: serine/threonine protein kinase [Kiritimatiellae bacterium]|nr:serine/threonine protein kinase [Kiritimatiellia bacterium]